MISAPSSANRSNTVFQVFLWTLRKHFLVSSLVLAVMCLVQPATVFLTGLAQKRDLLRGYTSETGLIDMQEIYFATQAFTMFLSALLIVVICSMVFGFMQQKRAVDMFHALPVKRAGLFAGKYFSGLILTAAPALVSIGITAIILNAMGLSLDGKEGLAMNMVILKDSGNFLLLQTASFTLAAFIAVNTGTMFDSVIALLGVNAAYPITLLLLTAFYSSRIYGFQMLFWEELYFMASPFVRMVAVTMELPVSAVIWWAVFTVGLFVLSLWQYTRRKSELTGNAFVFAPLKVFLKVLISFGVGLAVSTGFCLIFYSFWVFVISFLISSALAFVVVEAIVSRGFKNIPRGSIPFAFVLGLFVIIFASASAGGFGFETRIPVREAIEKVELVQTQNKYFDEPVELREAETIDAIYELHQKIIADVKKVKKEHLLDPITGGLGSEKYGSYFNYLYNDEYPITYEFIYHLKNGTTVHRSYSLSESKYSQLLKELSYMREVKLNSSMFSIVDNQEGWTQASIEDTFSTSSGDQSLSLTKEQSASIVAAYLKDLANETVEQAKNPQGQPLGTLYLTYVGDDEGNDEYSYSSEEITLWPHYTTLIGYLKISGIANQFGYELPQHTFAYITGSISAFLKQNGNDMETWDHSSFINMEDQIKKKDYDSTIYTSVTVDKADIAKLMELGIFRTDHFSEDGYFVVLHYEDTGYSSSAFYIPPEKAPSFLKLYKYSALDHSSLDY